MPLDPATGAVINAGSGILEAGLNIYGQKKQNKASQKFAREMYARQRADALSDWTQQNEYNDPAAQMKRLKMAGLNPNLVYGKGADAQMAAPIRTSQVQNPDFKTPDLSGVSRAGGAVGTYLQIEQQNLTNDNLKAQNTLLAKEALLKDAQTRSTNANANRSEFDYNFESETRPYQYQMRAEGVRKLGVDIDNSINSNDRAQIQLASNLNEAVERVLRSQAERSLNPERRDLLIAQAANARQNTALTAADTKLREQGIYPGDPLWLRQVITHLSTITDKVLPKIPGLSHPKENFKTRMGHMFKPWTNPNNKYWNK